MAAVADPVQVLVPVGRVERWWSNFEGRHGPTIYEVRDGLLCGHAEDGSSATASLPFGRSYAGPPRPADLVDATSPPAAWAVLLVRRGGFAVGRLRGEVLAESKIGQRHVQGKTKAGGWSQQRFARRRDNQAREAYDAAAGHAQRILDPVARELDLLVLGGDKAGVRAVLDDPRLQALAGVPQQWVTDVADPRRSVLDDVIGRARSVRVEVVDQQPR